MKGLTRIAVTSVLTGAALLLIGCAASSPVVRYGDAHAVETVNTDFGSTDLQMIAQKMTNSLLETPVLGQDRPVVWVARIKNKTSEHIDTQAITDKIETALIKSGKVRFAASSMANDVLDQLEYQNSGLVDRKTQKVEGRQIGAKYILGGEITSIVKNSGRVRDVYYKITLKLVNVESNIIEWADEKEIRKDSKRRLIGG